MKTSKGDSPSKNYKCEVCHDFGHILAKPGDAHYISEAYPNYRPCEFCLERRQTELTEKRYKSLFEVSGLNETERIHLRDISRNGKGTQDCLAAARRLMSKGAGFLVMHGTPGNGKSMILMSLVTQYINIGVPAVYVTAFHLLNYIKDAFGNRSQDSARDRLTDLEKIAVLCIDELDKPPWTPWEFSALSSIINERHRAAVDGSAITGIAMNQDPIDFLDDSFISRFLGMGEIIANNDSDYRVK